MHPSTVYHPRTRGQSGISDKAVEKYVHWFTRDYQDEWLHLLLTAEFAYKNNQHMSIGVSLFKENYGSNPTYGMIASSKQCIPTVNTRQKKMRRPNFWSLNASRQIKSPWIDDFTQGVSNTPQWNVVDRFLLNRNTISTTRPSRKLFIDGWDPFLIVSRYQLVRKNWHRLPLWKVFT